MKSRKEEWRNYNNKSEVKARRKVYYQRPEIKIKMRKYMREYYHKPEVKAKQKVYEQRPEVKARRKRLEKLRRKRK